MNHHPCIFQILDGGTNLCTYPKDVVYTFNYWGGGYGTLNTQIWKPKVEWPFSLLYLKNHLHNFCNLGLGGFGKLSAQRRKCFH